MNNYQMGLIKICYSIVCIFILQTVSAQWPQWRGAQSDGISSEENLLKVWPAEGPKLLWSSDAIGYGWGAVSIDNNVLYVVGRKDSAEFLSALDITGKLLWQTEIGRIWSTGKWIDARCTPTIYKNKVFTVTGLGDIACIDSKTGKTDWAFKGFEKFEGAGNAQFGMSEMPIVADDKVILTTGGLKTTVVALNHKTGETVWMSESLKDSAEFTTPALVTYNNKKVIVGGTKKKSFAVDFNTGKFVWKDDGNLGYVPLAYKKQVYFAGGKKGGKMLTFNDDLTNCSVLWEDTIKANNMGGSVIVGNKLYTTIDTKKSGLACIDPATGKVLSVNEAIKPSSILGTKDMLYCFDNKSGKISLVKINENNTELVSAFKVPFGKGPFFIAHMVIVNGVLYVRQDNVLMAFAVK
jgi:outer membrane protein assembly factor BamB